LRIVSLVPSLTELACELGLSKYIVGRTGYCVHPANQVATIAKVGGTKTVNLKKIEALKPTHVLLNRDENRLEDVNALRTFIPHLVVTHPLKVVDNIALYQQFGEVFDCAGASQVLMNSLTRELDITKATKWSPEHVLYLIWRDPWMTVSPQTYLADMLDQVGFKVVGPWLDADQPSDAPIRYPSFPDEQVRSWPVDHVLFSSEPFRFTESDFLATQGWANRGNNSVTRTLIDGELLSWYGSRAILGLRYLRDFRHALLQ
jgi:ABC-type Fe3+-hydroxamate transport system substrate-binding protein